MFRTEKNDRFSSRVGAIKRERDRAAIPGGGVSVALQKDKGLLPQRGKGRDGVLVEELSSLGLGGFEKMSSKEKFTSSKPDRSGGQFPPLFQRFSRSEIPVRIASGDPSPNVSFSPCSLTVGVIRESSEEGGGKGDAASL